LEIAALIRASERSLPNSSSDSKRGGEICEPVTAIRIALKATLGFSPISSISAPLNTSSISFVFQAPNPSTFESVVTKIFCEASSEILETSS